MIYYVIKTNKKLDINKCMKNPKEEIVTLPTLSSMARLKKIVSIILLPTFILTNLAFAEVIKNPNIKEPAKQSEVTTDPEKIVIPRDYGIVKAKYTARDSRKLVIHIQDAHCNYEAQSNIIKILECLIKNDGLSLMSVEGADGFIDTSWFKAFPDAEIRKEVADYFMKKGEITGPEFLAITSGHKIKLFGAETRSYYIENLNAFTSSYPLKEDTEKYFNQIKAVLNKLKNDIYSAELKELDAKLQDYEAKKLSFTDYVKYLEALGQKQKVNLRQYENLFKLISVLVYEKKINFNVVDKERATLIDAITKKLDKDQLKELVGKSLEFKISKISSAEYYDYLKGLAVKYGIVMPEEYPNLFNYIIYNSVYSRIENEKLFNDIKRFEEAIKERLFANDDQRTLDKLARHINILLGLTNIRLLNGDFDYYKERKAEFAHEVFADFIKKMAVKFGYAYEIDPPSQAVIESMPKLEDFYAIAIKRDKALVDNTVQAMKKEGAEISVLVTGGFHSEGITKLLEKQGVSYIVVCPNITKDVETPYIKILTNQRTPLEEILSDTGAAAEGKNMKGSMLAPYLITAARINKIDAIKERTAADLKAWAVMNIAPWLPKAEADIAKMGIQPNAAILAVRFNGDVDAALERHAADNQLKKGELAAFRKSAGEVQRLAKDVITELMTKEDLATDIFTPAQWDQIRDAGEAFNLTEPYEMYLAQMWAQYLLREADKGKAEGDKTKKNKTKPLRIAADPNKIGPDENYILTALMTRKQNSEREHDHRALKDDPKNATAAKKAVVTLNSLDAGRGENYVRIESLAKRLDIPVKDVKLTAKGTDVGFDILYKGGKTFVSIAEARLLQLIADTEDIPYAGLIFQPVVNSDSREPYENLMQSICLIDRLDPNKKVKRTYREALHGPLEKARIQELPMIDQADLPGINTATRMIATNLYGLHQPGGHGQLGFMFLYNSLVTPSPSDGNIHIRFFFNGDNVNAHADPSIVGSMVLNKWPVVKVTTIAAPIDKKGGKDGERISQEDGRTVYTPDMMELADAQDAEKVQPGQEKAFTGSGQRGGLGTQGEQRFNTNLIYLNETVLNSIFRMLLDRGIMTKGKLYEIISPLFIAKNAKTAEDGQSYYPIDGAIGVAVHNLNAFFEKSTDPRVKEVLAAHGIDRILHLVNIPLSERTKTFAPVKKAYDILLLGHSDYCRFNTNKFTLEDSEQGLIPPEFELSDPDLKGKDTKWWEEEQHVKDALGGAHLKRLYSLKIIGKVILPNSTFAGNVVIENKSGVAVDLNEKLSQLKRDGRLVLENIAIVIDKDGGIQKTESPSPYKGPWSQFDYALSEGKILSVMPSKLPSDPAVRAPGQAARGYEDSFSFVVSSCTGNAEALGRFYDIQLALKNIVPDRNKLFLPGTNTLHLALGGRYAENLEPLKEGVSFDALRRLDSILKAAGQAAARPVEAKLIGARITDNGTIVLDTEENASVAGIRGMVYDAMIAAGWEKDKIKINRASDGKPSQSGVITIGRMVPDVKGDHTMLSDAELSALAAQVAKLDRQLKKKPIVLKLDKISLVQPKREFLSEGIESSAMLILNGGVAQGNSAEQSKQGGITIDGSELTDRQKKEVNGKIRHDFEVGSARRIQVVNGVEIYEIPSLKDCPYLVAHSGRDGGVCDHKMRRIYFSPARIKWFVALSDDARKQFLAHEIQGHLDNPDWDEERVQKAYPVDIVLREAPITTASEQVELMRTEASMTKRKVVVIGGGSGTNFLSEVIKILGWETIDIITPFDDGGRTGLIKDYIVTKNGKIFIAIGDLTKKLVKKVTDSPSIQEVMETKVVGSKTLVEQLARKIQNMYEKGAPKNPDMRKRFGVFSGQLYNLARIFDEAQKPGRYFEGFNINGHSVRHLIYLACFLKNYDARRDNFSEAVDSANKEFSDLLGLSENLTYLSTVDKDLGYLIAKIKGEDQIIESQKGITQNTKPIEWVDISSKERPNANEEVIAQLNALKAGDKLVLGPGSFYTSLICNLLPKGMVKAIVDAKERGAITTFVFNPIYSNEDISMKNEAGNTFVQIVKQMEAHLEDGGQSYRLDDLFSYCIVNDADANSYEARYRMTKKGSQNGSEKFERSDKVRHGAIKGKDGLIEYLKSNKYAITAITGDLMTTKTTPDGVEATYDIEKFDAIFKAVTRDHALSRVPEIVVLSDPHATIEALYSVKKALPGRVIFNNGDMVDRGDELWNLMKMVDYFTLGDHEMWAIGACLGHDYLLAMWLRSLYRNTMTTAILQDLKINTQELQKFLNTVIDKNTGMTNRQLYDNKINNVKKPIEDVGKKYVGPKSAEEMVLFNIWIKLAVREVKRLKNVPASLKAVKDEFGKLQKNEHLKDLLVSDQLSPVEEAIFSQLKDGFIKIKGDDQRSPKNLASHLLKGRVYQIIQPLPDVPSGNGLKDVSFYKPDSYPKALLLHANIPMDGLGRPVDLTGKPLDLEDLKKYFDELNKNLARFEEQYKALTSGKITGAEFWDFTMDGRVTDPKEWLLLISDSGYSPLFAREQMRIRTYTESVTEPDNIAYAFLTRNYNTDVEGKTDDKEKAKAQLNKDGIYTIEAIKESLFKEYGLDPNNDFKTVDGALYLKDEEANRKIAETIARKFGVETIILGHIGRNKKTGEPTPLAGGFIWMIDGSFAEKGGTTGSRAALETGGFLLLRPKTGAQSDKGISKGLLVKLGNVLENKEGRYDAAQKKIVPELRLKDMIEYENMKLDWKLLTEAPFLMQELLALFNINTPDGRNALHYVKSSDWLGYYNSLSVNERSDLREKVRLEFISHNLNADHLFISKANVYAIIAGTNKTADWRLQTRLGEPPQSYLLPVLVDKKPSEYPDENVLIDPAHVAEQLGQKVSPSLSYPDNSIYNTPVSLQSNIRSLLPDKSGAMKTWMGLDGQAPNGYDLLVKGVNKIGCNLIIEDGLIADGVEPTVDAVSKPYGQGRDVRIDEEYFLCLLSYENGVELVLELVEHQICHIENNGISEEQIEEKAPTKRVRGAIEKIKMADEIVKLKETFEKAMDGNEAAYNEIVAMPKEKLIVYFEERLQKTLDNLPEDIFGFGKGYDVRGNARPIEGGVENLTPANLYAVGKLLASNYAEAEPKDKALITGDIRLHTPILRYVMALGAASAGVDVDYCPDYLTTGAHNLLSTENEGNYKFMVQVSGSHGVPQKNGFKIKAFLGKKDAKGIMVLEPLYAEKLEGLYWKDKSAHLRQGVRQGAKNGTVTERPGLRDTVVKIMSNTLPDITKDEIVVIDPRGGAGGPMVKDLLLAKGFSIIDMQEVTKDSLLVEISRLWAEGKEGKRRIAVMLNMAPDGTMGNGKKIWDPSKAEALKETQELVNLINHANLIGKMPKAIGSVFDGDADRITAILEDGAGVPAFEMTLPYYQRFLRHSGNQEVMVRLAKAGFGPIQIVCDVRANSKLLGLLNQINAELQKKAGKSDKNIVEGWFITTGYPPQLGFMQKRMEELNDFVDKNESLKNDKEFKGKFIHFKKTYFTAEASGHNFFHISKSYEERVCDCAVAGFFTLLNIRETMTTAEVPQGRPTEHLTDLFSNFPKAFSSEEVHIPIPNPVKRAVAEAVGNWMKEKYGQELKPYTEAMQEGDYLKQPKDAGYVTVSGFKIQLKTGESALVRSSNTGEELTTIFEGYDLKSLVKIMKEVAERLREEESKGANLSDLDAEIIRLEAEMNKPVGLVEEKTARAIWRQEPSIWKDFPHNAGKNQVVNWMGWLHAAERFTADVQDIQKFVAELPYDNVVVLGTGGSGRSARTLSQVFGTKNLFVTYSPEGAEIRALLAQLEKNGGLANTLFIVASKSGTTTESATQEAIFRGMLLGMKAAGKLNDEVEDHFAGITDEGTKIADRPGDFRQVFINNLKRDNKDGRDIGGRFSAMSLFGLVPLASAKVDITQMLGQAAAESKEIAAAVDSNNPENVVGFKLGNILSALNAKGYDHVVQIPEESTSMTGPWAEQLFNESLTKKEAAPLWVYGEPLLKDGKYYGKNVIFIRIAIGKEKGVKVSELNGRPLVEVTFQNFGQLILNLELAVTAWGYALGVNPFIQESVENSKKLSSDLEKELKATPNAAEAEKVLLAAEKKDQTLENNEVVTREGIKFYFAGRTAKDIQTELELARTGKTVATATAKDLIGAFMSTSEGKGYIGLFPYTNEDSSLREAFSKLRANLKENLVNRPTTLFDFGPGFHHSNNVGITCKDGVTLLITFDTPPEARLPIPEKPYTTDQLLRAMVVGELGSLQKGMNKELGPEPQWISIERRVMRIHLPAEYRTNPDKLVELLSVKTVDLEGVSGLPITMNPVNGELKLGDDIVCERRWSRPVKDAGTSIANPSAIDKYNRDREVYYGYRNVALKKDATGVDKLKLRFNITVLMPGVVHEGNDAEFIMTKGHIHTLDTRTNTYNHPEFYEVWNSVALYVQQGVNPKTGQFEFVATIAKPGDKVLLIPGYSHRTINIGNEPLVMANWISDEVGGKKVRVEGMERYKAAEEKTPESPVKADFKEIEKKNGYTYWVVRTPEGVVKFIHNPNYDAKPTKVSNPAPVRFMKPVNEIKELSLSDKKPMYPQAGNENLKVLEDLAVFLRNPKAKGLEKLFESSLEPVSEREFMQKIAQAIGVPQDDSAMETTKEMPPAAEPLQSFESAPTSDDKRERFDHTIEAIMQSSNTGERARKTAETIFKEESGALAKTHLIFVKSAIPEEQLATTTVINLASICADYYNQLEGYTADVVDTYEEAVKLLAKNPDWDKTNTIVGLVDKQALDKMTAELEANNMQGKTKLLPMERFDRDQFVPLKGFFDLMSVLVRVNRPLDKPEDRELRDSIRDLLNEIGVRDVANLVNALSVAAYFEDPIKFAKNFIIRLLPPTRAASVAELRDRYNAAKKVVESL